MPECVLYSGMCASDGSEVSVVVKAGVVAVYEVSDCGGSVGDDEVAGDLCVPSAEVGGG